MSDQDLHADDNRFHGTVIGKELLDLLKMLHRTCASGVLHLDADVNRASLCLDGGSIRAAFFNELIGSQALSRVILIGEAEFRFELATAHTVAGYARNIAKDTALILTTVEAMLAEANPFVSDSPAENGDIQDATKPTAKALAPKKASASTPTPATAAPIPKQTESLVTISGFYASPLLPSPDGTGALERSDGDTPAPKSAAADEDCTIRITSFLPPEPGAIIGKYELKEELGRGASSIVFKAKHPSLGVDVVLKVLMPERTDNDSHRLSTINEARLLARLNHPNILRVFDFTEIGRWPHLVTELVDGQSLLRLIRDKRSLTSDLALPLICQAAEAMSYAHATLGVVHCDIKPDNILMTKDLQVKMADFGLAKSSCEVDGIDAVFPAGTVAGTPVYIAPEQVQGGRAACDHRSDIYSLGATLYHAVTGRTPYNDPDPVQLMVKRLSEAPIPPHLVNPKVERRVSQLIMSMMARDPHNRMQSWDEVLELMSDILDSLAPATDRYRSETGGTDNIIRRRTSFWNYVPTRLFRRSTTDQKDVG